MRKRPERYEFVRVNGRWLIRLRDVAPKDER